jgi:beta-N-acetylhexosaminidase
MKNAKNIKRILSLFLCVAIVFTILAGCRSTGHQEKEISDRVTELMKTMTLEEKVGQMMIASFRVWQDLRTEPVVGEDGETVEPEKIPITELNDEIRASLEKNHFGGTLLFADNFKDAEQTYRLVQDLQSSNKKGSNIPMFVSCDQEGGSVARITFGTTGTGNMALAASGDTQNAEQMASVYGEELKALGINNDFAPVIDINNNPSNPVIGVRSFSDDANKTAKYGVAFMKGLNSTGTIATLKHFPGHGDTDTDSHTGFPLIDKSYEELKQFELVPYKTAIKNGAEMIMTAHIQYPQIEKETYVSISTGEEVYVPATMSTTILTDILKKDMGFEGVVVTDALDMAAITDNFEFEDVLCMTINAGADMLILPVIYNTDLFEQTDTAVEVTVKLVNEGKISEERIDDAVKRILTVKEKHGILDLNDFTVKDEEIQHANELVGAGRSRQIALEIAEKSLTLVKNDKKAYPLSDANAPTLILFADSCASRVGYGELVKHDLNKENITVMVNDAENGEECVQAAKDAQNVILISRAYNEACLDPSTGDGFSTAVFDEIIKVRHEDSKPVIVISCQLPYDAARFTEADAMILSYCSSAMRQVPNETGEGSAYAPNLYAAIRACFEGPKLTGKTPVDLPKLDEMYKLTDEVFYKRGTFVR